MANVFKRSQWMRVLLALIVMGVKGLADVPIAIMIRSIHLIVILRSRLLSKLRKVLNFIHGDTGERKTSLHIFNPIQILMLLLKD